MVNHAFCSPVTMFLHSIMVNLNWSWPNAVLLLLLSMGEDKVKSIIIIGSTVQTLLWLVMWTVVCYFYLDTYRMENSSFVRWFVSGFIPDSRAKQFLVVGVCPVHCRTLSFPSVQMPVAPLPSSDNRKCP